MRRLELDDAVEVRPHDRRKSADPLLWCDPSRADRGESAVDDGLA